MKLNRTKVLVISLVVITLALGGAALYIANRLQNQIQTPSSAAIAPLESLQINKTACATGTKGQNGCDYIGSKGLQDAIDDAKAEPVTLPLKSAKLTLTVKAGSYDFTNSSLVITDGPNKLDVDVLGESGTIFLGNKTSNNIITLFGVISNQTNGDIIDTSKLKSILYFASSKDAKINISKITLDTVHFVISKSTIAKISSVIVKNGVENLVFGGGNSNITVENSTFINSKNGIGIANNSKLVIQNSVMNNFDNTLFELDGNSILEGSGNIITNKKNTFNSGYNAFQCDGTPKVQNWKYNNVWNNQVGNFESTCPNKNSIGTDGNISADPLFTNPASGDFTLKAGSPAINGVTNADGTKSNMGLIFTNSNPVVAAEPTCVEMKIGKSASSLTKLNTRDKALLLGPTDTLTVTYSLKNATAGDTRRIHIKNDQNFRVANDMNQQLLVSYSNTNNTKLLTTGVASGSDQKYTYTLTYAELFPNDTTALSFPANPAETPQWASGTPPNILQISGTVKKATSTADGTFDKDCVGFVKRQAITVVATSSPNAICKDLLIGTSLTNQAKKNTREAPLSVSAGSDIYITHTLSGLDTADRTRYLRIYNGQNKSKDDGSDNYNYTSYHNNNNAYQKSTGTGTTDIKFTYKLTYAQLFQADSAALGFAQTPAETPQWASGQVPNYVRLAVPVKPFTNDVGGSYDQNCLAYVKRADATVTLVNTSNAVCVGMTIGKNGGTQSAKKTRDNPLLVSSGDTINITHTLSGLSSTENYRTLRMYNAQNISATGDNTLNSFTSYNDQAATYQTTQRVANGSNFDFKYTLTYDQLFKADTTALVKAATPAETPQWASGGIPNLVKVAVPVKPFGTNLLGTYSANCLAYISRVGISLASTSGGTSGGTSGNGTSGGGTSGSGSNNDLPATDLSAFDIFKLIGGAIFLLGGITIMKYRSRFENI